MEDNFDQLIKLCPFLARFSNLREPVERMEKAFVMNGGELTDDPIQNAINYLISLEG